MTRKLAIEYYRNISIQAHVAAGKARLIECMLSTAGARQSMAEASDGTPTVNLIQVDPAKALSWRGIVQRLPEHRITVGS